MLNQTVIATLDSAFAELRDAKRVALVAEFAEATLTPLERAEDRVARLLEKYGPDLIASAKREAAYEGVVRAARSAETRMRQWVNETPGDGSFGDRLADDLEAITDALSALDAFEALKGQA